MSTPSPTASSSTYNRGPGASLKITISDLTTDTIQSLGTATHGTVSKNDTYIFYLPQSGNGGYWSGQAWTGAAMIEDVGTFTSTCGDWTVSATTGRIAMPGLARRIWNINLSAIVCNNIPVSGPRLMCYEP